jgi:GNAT superfamily N-acetyltransferase
MSYEIVRFSESLIDQAVSVFNRENERFEFVVPLTPSLFKERISSKSCFSEEGCFLIMEKDRAIGLTLTCLGINRDKTDFDPKVGVIDGLFFPERRFQLGEKLLARAIEHLRNRGVQRIYGFASWGGYPFWRGIYCGSEPVCLTEYKQAWIAFMGQGFQHHQQSLNYLGKTRVLPCKKDLVYAEEALDTSSPWARDSWKNLEPKLLFARENGALLGRIAFTHMPDLSDHRNIPTAGIYGMWVTEHARRQGIASSMMANLFERLGDSGIKEILVGARIENIPARKTYERAGMKAVAFRTGTMRIYEG